MNSRITSEGSSDNETIMDIINKGSSNTMAFVNYLHVYPVGLEALHGSKLLRIYGEQMNKHLKN